MRAVAVCGVLAGALALGGCAQPPPAPEPISTVTALDGLITDVTSVGDVFPVALPASRVSESGDLVVKYSEGARLGDDYGMAIVSHDGSTAVIIPAGGLSDLAIDFNYPAHISDSTVVFANVSHGRAKDLVFYDRESQETTSVRTVQALDEFERAIDVGERLWDAELVGDRLYVIADTETGGDVLVEVSARDGAVLPLGDAVLGDLVLLGRDVCEGGLTAWSSTSVGETAFVDIFRFDMSGQRPTGVDDESRIRRSAERDGYTLWSTGPLACGERWVANVYSNVTKWVATGGPRSGADDVFFGTDAVWVAWNGAWATISPIRVMESEGAYRFKSGLVDTATGEVRLMDRAQTACWDISITGDWIAWQEYLGDPDDAFSLDKCVTHIGRLSGDG